jgi:ribosomal protein L44E
MTTLQKTLIAAALVVAGGGVYEGRQASSLCSEARALERQQASLKEQTQRLQQERDETTNRLALLVEENNRWKANSNEVLRLRSELVLLQRDSEQIKALRRLQGTDPQAAATIAWLDRVQRLKGYLAKNPDAAIPEFASLTEQDWLQATLAPGLDSDKKCRYALSSLRRTAEFHYLEPMRDAIVEYTKAHDGKWPADLAQVKPYLKTPIDDAILQRYQTASADSLPMSAPVVKGWVLTEKAPVDLECDARLMLGSEDGSLLSFKDSVRFKTLTPAIQAYYAANNGQMPADADLEKLAPYVRTAEEQAALASVKKDYEAASVANRAYYLKILQHLKPK